MSKTAAPLPTLGSSTAISARAQRIYTPSVVSELTQIETDLGGRRALVGMLVLAPLSPDLSYVLGMLGDPQHQQKSLAEICAIGHILPGDLLKHLASAALLKGKVRASRRIAEGIEDVAADVMRRAAPYEDSCHACLGTGSVTPDPTPAIPNPSPGPCDTCNGTGKLRYQPDLERQKLAVDLANLLPKGGGIQIAQINQSGEGKPGGGGGLTEQLQEVTDRILYDRGLPPPPADTSVEGEVLEEE